MIQNDDFCQLLVLHLTQTTNHLSLVAEDAAEEFEDNVDDGEEFAEEVTD